MNPAEELRCAREYVRTKDPALAQRMVTANLRLVVKIAHGYAHHDRDLRDLVQEGNLGLIHAVTRYDPRRGVKLCSYAAWWIRAYILKYTVANWRLVKTGTTQAQRRLFFRLRAEQGKLERQGGQPDVRRLAAGLNVKTAEVVSMMERFAGSDTSLDAPAHPHEVRSRSIGDSLASEAALRPDVRAEASEFAQAVGASLKGFGRTLHGRERAIYLRRLMSEEPETLAQLAARFGVTRERTRQVEQRLKGRIRDYLRNQLGDALEPVRAAA
ncbi:MAG TPA: sigma-70 family RNA polymerase sigma factor [Polyangia bacterium]|nr:sigma-70 family RNA polymerase sigma factor [Polyangia bacterium]